MLAKETVATDGCSSRECHFPLRAPHEAVSNPTTKRVRKALIGFGVLSEGEKKDVKWRCPEERVRGGRAGVGVADKTHCIVHL